MKKLVEFWRLLRKQNGEKGAVDIGGILLMGIAMVFLSIGFIMFPIATDATDDILGYVYSGNASITDASYTGLTAITGITPLLILLGFVMAAVVTGFLGLKVTKGESSAKATPGSLMMLGLAIVFIAVGLIMFPVALDGISSVYDGNGAGISTAYTGLQPILLVTPMLVLLSFLAASVISGFFGIKSLGSGAKG